MWTSPEWISQSSASRPDSYRAELVSIRPSLLPSTLCRGYDDLSSLYGCLRLFRFLVTATHMSMLTRLSLPHITAVIRYFLCRYLTFFVKGRAPIPRPDNGISLSTVYALSHNPVLHTAFAKLDLLQTSTRFTLSLTAVFIPDLTCF